MTVPELKTMYRGLYKKKRKYKEYCLRIEEIETRAEKMTTSYEKSESTTMPYSTSKLEDYCIRVVEIQEKADNLKKEIDYAENLLKHLKSHQRYLIKTCLIYHNSYDKVAEKENTSSHNIEHIVFNALKKLENIT